MKEVEIEFLEWADPHLGVVPVAVEGGKPLVLKAKISEPRRKPLTDEQIEALAKALEARGDTLRQFVRAVEAAHGIKENA